jgi:hypothetical protein
MLKINIGASTRNHGQCMKYISFPWPPVVAAHNRKRLERALQSSRIYLSQKNYPYTQNQLCSSDPTIPFKLC